MSSNTNTIFNNLTHPNLLPLPIFTQLKTQQNPTRITFPTRPNRTHLRASSSTNPGSVTYSPPEPAQTLYEILGIISSPNNNNNNSNNNNYGVTLGEIKKAYKEMALRYHPDVSPPGRVEEYTVRFIRVQEAYETLSDPNRRALYDGHLAMGLNHVFPSRRRCRDDIMETDDKSEWKSRWQSQLSELKVRSANKNSRGSMSWSEKIRRQNDNLSNEV